MKYDFIAMLLYAFSMSWWLFRIVIKRRAAGDTGDIYCRMCARHVMSPRWYYRQQSTYCMPAAFTRRSPTFWSCFVLRRRRRERCYSHTATPLMASARMKLYHVMPAPSPRHWLRRNNHRKLGGLPNAQNKRKLQLMMPFSFDIMLFHFSD